MVCYQLLILTLILSHLQEVQDDVVIGTIATRDCQNVVDTLLSHVTYASAPPPHNNFKSAAAPLSHDSVAHLSPFRHRS